MDACDVYLPKIRIFNRNMSDQISSHCPSFVKLIHAFDIEVQNFTEIIMYAPETFGRIYLDDHRIVSQIPASSRAIPSIRERSRGRVAAPKTPK